MRRLYSHLITAGFGLGLLLATPAQASGLQAVAATAGVRFRHHLLQLTRLPSAARQAWPKSPIPSWRPCAGATPWATIRWPGSVCR